MSRWREDAAIARRRGPSTTASERSGSGSDALSSMLRRGAAIGPTLVRCGAMDGVTVVDHVLLRRLLSILRDKDTPHRVFRETHDRRGADPRLRGDARRCAAPTIAVETPLEATAGVRLADEVVRRRDPARRARPGRRVPAAGAGGARRAPRHVPRRGGAAAGRLLREHPVGRRGRRGVRRRPDARHRRLAASQAIARLKRAGAQRLHFVCLVAAPEGVRGAAGGAPRRADHDRHDRPRARRATATSAPGWATRATASSAPTAEVGHDRRTGYGSSPARQSGGISLMAYMQLPGLQADRAGHGLLRARRPAARAA